MNPLVDATEMYLRTVWELEEEGIVPLRARLVERLHLSAPAVSETVARLEDEGLLRVGADRRLELTEEGRQLAVRVMRKHRLVERLLTDVIRLPWEDVHVEACRWEHVVSDAVEDRLVDLLEKPTTDPHGNPIPGIGEAGRDGLRTLTDAAGDDATVVLARISEKLQSEVDTMRELREAGILPGALLHVRGEGDGVAVAVGETGELRLSPDIAGLLYVSSSTQT